MFAWILYWYLQCAMFQKQKVKTIRLKACRLFHSLLVQLQVNYLLFRLSKPLSVAFGKNSHLSPQCIATYPEPSAGLVYPNLYLD